MKDELRYKLKIKRKYFQNYAREAADRAIAENFIAALGGYNSFFVYNSFSSEAGTKLITEFILGSGKKLYMPRVEGSEMVAAEYGEMRKGAFGISEPAGQAFNGDIEVTVTPLLAVNSEGFRLGYGKGFYDRYFQTRKTIKAGLGYSFQIERFEPDEWDVPLDLFICEKGIYRYAKNG